jgi:hypothetical protein
MAFRKFPFRSLTFVLLALSPAALVAQEGVLKPDQPQGITPDQIIQKFAAKEKEFRDVWERYTYRQTSKVEEVDGGGEFQLVTDITFNNDGKRVQTVVFAPQPTLSRISMSKEDYDDIQNNMPFSLTSDDLPKYQIMYVGQQKEDELNTYVFDVAPKTMAKGQRYFQGRIWVDDRDYQIVKTHGKMVPDIRNKNNENLFPAFTTYREEIDGEYWFPTYTSASDTLHFSTGDVPIKIIVKYTNYKRFGSNVKISYEGKEVEGTKPNTPTNKPKQ